MQANRLIQEKSPYLLQHAHNPVDWFPWGDEAFGRARREGKVIFLSVGYSTCHWCHVMERESFEKEAVAAILNRHFISIKVDREERPDVDRVYMTYLQAVTGGGGWPLSVWLTPDLRPFLGGTYFPPEDCGGRAGFKSVLLHIAEVWEKDRAAITASGESVLERLRALLAGSPVPGGDWGESVLDLAFHNIAASYDPVEGGFGPAPKFPTPVTLQFLLKYAARAQPTGSGPDDSRIARDMVLHTLRKMAQGGIQDVLGGGFHRYATDARWRVPHFEKMLADQAQLACVYLDAFQWTRDPFFSEVARNILDYVLRDLTGEEGSFLSAEDADSPRPETPETEAEGAFYVWTRAEIADALGEAEARLFFFVYGVEPGGNVPEDPHGEFAGRNILFFARNAREAAASFQTGEGAVRDRLAAARRRLLTTRVGRPRPHRDDKAITAWNGLMISAFARGFQVLGDEAYRKAARRAETFVRTRLQDGERRVLLRRHREGESALDGYADDYAFLIQGLLDLYEADFDPAHLDWAQALQERQDRLFWDDRAAGYFSTTGQDPSVLLRIKEDHDGAEPSPNSVAALNLFRLAEITGLPELVTRAQQTMSAFGERLRRAPQAMPGMMSALAFHLAPPLRIVLAGHPDALDSRVLLAEVHARYLPGKVLLLADVATKRPEPAEGQADRSAVPRTGGNATATVCTGTLCKAPVTDPAALKDILDALSPWSGCATP